MASVTMSYTFTTGDRIDVKIKLDPSYPDALNQASNEAQRAFGVGLRLAIDSTADEADDTET